MTMSMPRPETRFSKTLLKLVLKPVSRLIGLSPKFRSLLQIASRVAS